jgi:tripartite-type tricarboxylate transporter receptor subunit TctC
MTRHARTLGLGCLFITACATAQTYPSKPIHVVVPFPPGGSVDWATRLVGQKLSESLKVPVLVENRSGAGGQLGVETVLRAAADGYTVLASSSGSIVILPHFKKLPYDMTKDLTAVALINILGVGIAVNAALPVKNLQDLVKVSKETSGGLNYSISSIGNQLHLAGELFKLMSGAVLVPIPYKGTAPATAAVASGEVAVTVSDLQSLIPQEKAGRIRILATINSSRAAGYPTVAEQGFPKYACDTWVGMLATAGTPADVVARLNADVNRALSAPDVREAFVKAGSYAQPMTPEEMQRFIADESRKWGEVISKAKISGGE